MPGGASHTPAQGIQSMGCYDDLSMVIWWAGVLALSWPRLSVGRLHCDGKWENVLKSRHGGGVGGGKTKEHTQIGHQWLAAAHCNGLSRRQCARDRT